MACTPKRQPLSIEIEQHSIYRHNLQIYNIPPSGHIKLDEFIKWCVDRLRVLSIVERISLSHRTKSTKTYVPILISELKNNGIHDFANLISTHNCPRTEHLTRNECMSHFMLRFAFSFEDTHRQWFFTQETKLFKWRLSLLSADDTKTFMDINGLQYSAISQEEKQEIKEDLRTCYAEIGDIENTTFYKVHFTSVLKPVRKRQIYLKDGIAYVPETKLFWLILPEFKQILNQSFARAREIIWNTYDDERITQILTLPTYINTKKRKYGKYREVFRNELDELSRTSYPLCMKVLHEALRTKHHLTNGGRVQYSLFLKGIGLSLFSAIQFWKDELTKTVDERTFDKEYKYYIKHLYGQVGRHVDYNPFSCSKIFNSIIGVRDDHGCPYKRMESHVLQHTLSKCGLVRSDIDAIMQHSKEGHYLQACKIYYNATNNCMLEKTFDHPNVYFEHSLRNIETYSDTED